MTHLINKGESVLMYPEGTWNLAPSKPTLPLYWGIVDISRNTGVPIIPLVAEYYSDICYVKFGEPLYIGKDMDKQCGIDSVSDSLATLKWDIWEMFPVKQRTEGLKREFEIMVQRRLQEYPKLNLEYEKSIVRKTV